MSDPSGQRGFADWRALIVRVHREIGILQTLYVLPFAALGALLATDVTPPMGQLLLILGVVVFGRGLVVSLVRAFRAPYDVANPNPGDEGVPTAVWAAFAFHAAAFLVFLSYQLNPLAGHLSWLVAILFVAYAATRRATGLSHVLLGIGLGAVPVGAWVALRGELGFDAASALVLGAGTAAWATGFDMMSVFAPAEHREGAHRFTESPRLGPDQIVFVARALHVMAVLLFAAALRQGFPGPAWVAALLVGGLLVLAHIPGAKGPLRDWPRFLAFNVATGPVLLLGGVLGAAWR